MLEVRGGGVYPCSHADFSGQCDPLSHHGSSKSPDYRGTLDTSSTQCVLGNVFVNKILSIFFPLVSFLGSYKRYPPVFAPAPALVGCPTTTFQLNRTYKMRSGKDYSDMRSCGVARLHYVFCSGLVQASSYRYIVIRLGNIQKVKDDRQRFTFSLRDYLTIRA